MKPDPLALQVERRIFLIRQQRVMLDYDLASLYGVETRALKQAVRRNRERFPEDFMFILTREETETLVSQSVIPSLGRLGGAAPYAFAEQGVAMLSSVLRSPRAVQVNIATETVIQYHKCCVFCSFGTVKGPPIQANQNCCRSFPTS